MCEWSGVAMVGKLCEWSEVAKRERWENIEVAWSERWECIEVAIWERWEGSEQRRWDGICMAPGKRTISRDSLQQFHTSYIILWIIAIAWMMVA